jgi:hypothetical protein
MDPKNPFDCFLVACLACLDKASICPRLCKMQKQLHKQSFNQSETFFEMASGYFRLLVFNEAGSLDVLQPAFPSVSALPSITRNPGFRAVSKHLPPMSSSTIV